MNGEIKKKKTNLKKGTKTKKKNPKKIRVKSNIKIKLLQIIKDETKIFFLNNNKINKDQILYKNQIEQNTKR